MTTGVMHKTWRHGKHAVRQQGQAVGSAVAKPTVLPALPDGLNAQQAADARGSEEIAGVYEKISSELLSWGVRIHAKAEGPRAETRQGAVPRRQ